MDALALVCTLYADGPRSLRRLREGGCADLDALRRLDPRRLAEMLRWTEPDARRLLREARALGERLGLDPEERHQPLLDRAERSDAATPSTAVERAGASERAGTTRTPTPGAPEAAEAPAAKSGSAATAVAERAASVPRGDRDLLSAVVARWREADLEARASAARVAGRPDPAAAGRAADAAEPPLRAGFPDGLRPSEAQALAAAGIRTVTALAGADPTELALATGLPFSRLRRLQFDARRVRAAAGR